MLLVNAAGRIAKRRTHTTSSCCDDLGADSDRRFFWRSSPKIKTDWRVQSLLDPRHVSASLGQTLKPLSASAATSHGAEIPNASRQSSLNRWHIELVVMRKHTDRVSLT
jgi:hypothetical protein